MNNDSIVRINYVLFRASQRAAAGSNTIEDHITGTATLLALEKFGLPVLDPLRSGQTLAFWAVSIAAAIERIPFIGALIAAFEVAAENRCAAHLDGGHDAPLSHRHRRAMLLSISLSVAAEHVRHFQLRTIHGAGTQKY
jgi:hypothetical protein